MSTLNTELHPLSHFKTDEHDLRVCRDQNHVEELKELIKNEGFKGVLKVEIKDEDEIEVKSGNYRLEALRQLKDEGEDVISELEVIPEKGLAVSPKECSFNSIIDQVSDNNIQQANSPIEKASAVGYQLAELGKFSEDTNNSILSRQGILNLNGEDELIKDIHSTVNQLRLKESDENEETKYKHVLLSVNLNTWNNFYLNYLSFISLPQDLKEIAIAISDPNSSLVRSEWRIENEDDNPYNITLVNMLDNIEEAKHRKKFIGLAKSGVVTGSDLKEISSLLRDDDLRKVVLGELDEWNQNIISELKTLSRRFKNLNEKKSSDDWNNKPENVVKDSVQHIKSEGEAPSNTFMEVEADTQDVEDHIETPTIEPQDYIDEAKSIRGKLEKWDNEFLDIDIKKFDGNYWPEFKRELKKINERSKSLLSRPSPDNEEEFHDFLEKIGGIE